MNMIINVHTFTRMTRVSRTTDSIYACFEELVLCVEIPCASEGLCTKSENF